MNEHILHDGQLRLINTDCLNYLKTLPENSIDLILTDPPYFQVKKNAWDNQWPDTATFLKERGSQRTRTSIPLIV